MSLWGNDNSTATDSQTYPTTVGSQVLASTANVIAQKISLGGQCPVNYVRLLANLLLFISARTLPTDRFDQSPQLPCSVVLLMI